MKFRHVHFIINPAAGKKEPILSYINTAMCDTDMDWDISVIKKNKSIEDIIGDAAAHTDIIAIYGGDGSVCSAVGALRATNTPMAIIPGGTANVTAKELGIPVDSIAALELLKGSGQLEKVDTGLVNDMPFLLRINLGIMADMVTGTSDELKGSIGQLAYGLTAIKNINTAEQVSYAMVIDGMPIQEKSVALTITNCGSNGIGNMSLQPGISATDGLLDILSLHTADITSLVKIAGSSLLNTETDALKHWKCRDVKITSGKAMNYICDDVEKTADELHIQILPASLSILTPTNKK